VKQEIDFQFNIHSWNKITISIMESAMYVILNRKYVIVDNLIHDSFADPEGGTVGFGSNNIITEFADISMSIIMPDEFMIWIQNLRKGIQAKDSANDEAAKQDEASKLEEEAPDAKSIESGNEEVSLEDIVS